MPDVIEVISKTHKRYADRLRKDRELVAQIEEIGQRGRELTVEQNKHIATWQAQQPRHKPQPKLRHQGAADLLGSLLPEQSPEEPARLCRQGIGMVLPRCAKWARR
ncbi:superfamily II RNA helicase [Bradyrhizobium sp. USDA 4524]|uniref:hypothetical protein n=1 Tax=unclassified Bradyrhizobium TaxID=2631580 RepID=UPI00209D448B|nr:MULTISPECIES: hypothetical protein [unclassified Bradyrhizobium]MCP1845581.1 superfamily II RNA helicase [Bradyrhizobium sp. USDA 4538]MCP1907096.1 superfamily II RNA helicase [Bradyrhizobium sp. USDA 4537]MCP1985571.1 superfamily II RNA helicase [Bradyrhizobium sp. USDA 4539]